jgi:hypothetical protein
VIGFSLAASRTTVAGAMTTSRFLKGALVLASNVGAAQFLLEQTKRLRGVRVRRVHADRPIVGEPLIGQARGTLTGSSIESNGEALREITRVPRLVRAEAVCQAGAGEARPPARSDVD